MNSKGLNKLPIDIRDYSHHAAFGTLAVSELPINDFTIYDQLKYSIVWGDTLGKIANIFGLSLGTLLALNPQIKNSNIIYCGQVITIPARANKILNQLDLDFCTAYTSIELQNAIFGVECDPLYEMAKTLEIVGDWSQEGADLRSAATSVVKYGSLPLSYAPFVYTGQGNITRNFVANYKSYPTALDITAMKEKDLSYFAVDGTNDMFDNIRSVLWMHKQERRAVSFGLFWHDAWTEVVGGVIPDAMPNDSDGGGHDISIVGQKTINGEIYLIAQNHWGDTAGDGGYYYFPRSIIDLCANEGYGSYTFSNKDASGLTTAGGFMTSLATFFNKIFGNI